MEQVIDCIKKRDWVGLRRALWRAHLAGSRAMYKAIGMILTVFTLSMLAGAGAFFGVKAAFNYQQTLTGSTVIYIMPLVKPTADCGENGCG